MRVPPLRVLVLGTVLLEVLAAVGVGRLLGAGTAVLLLLLGVVLGVALLRLAGRRALLAATAQPLSGTGLRVVLPRRQPPPGEVGWPLAAGLLLLLPGFLSDLLAVVCLLPGPRRRLARAVLGLLRRVPGMAVVAGLGGPGSYPGRAVPGEVLRPAPPAHPSSSAGQGGAGRVLEGRVVDPEENRGR